MAGGTYALVLNPPDARRPCAPEPARCACPGLGNVAELDLDVVPRKARIAVETLLKVWASAEASAGGQIPAAGVRCIVKGGGGAYRTSAQSLPQCSQRVKGPAPEAVEWQAADDCDGGFCAGSPWGRQLKQAAKSFRSDPHAPVLNTC